jgi:hypothetical protein
MEPNLMRSTFWESLVLASLTLGGFSSCQSSAGGDEPNQNGGPTDAASSKVSEIDDTQADGASSEAPMNAEDTVTWYQHVAPLVTAKCGSCHTDGGIAPFSVDDYEQAAIWAKQMNTAIEAGTMPPWGAQETEECTPPAPFKDDIRLSQEEKDLFAAWVAQDTPEGDALEAAELPTPLSLDLPSADRQLTIPSSVTVEGTADDFVCFALDPEITEEVWLTGTQVFAGNDAIVHHALVFLDREGQGANMADDNGQYRCFGSPGLDDTRLLGAWAPGAVPGVLPPDTGMYLQPGDKLVVQVHYHPTGQGPETDDATRIDLQWTQEEPSYVGGIFLIGNFDEVDAAIAGGEGYGLMTGPDFVIPAGAPDHREVNRFWLDDQGDPLARLVDIYVWMIGTHMHYVGTDMKITVETPSGDEQCFVQTPSWDFNWQRGYFFDGDVGNLPTIHAGDSLTMRCTYDNSLENPFVREALDDQGLTEPRDVALGDETLDEMCLGVFGLAVQSQYAEAFGLQ